MLTQNPNPTPTEVQSDPHARRPGSRPQDDTVCWFEDAWTSLADAKVSIMTHSFLYGTAVFEGIRAYWNAEEEQLYLLRAREHFERIVDSSKILMMDPHYSVDQMVDMTIELLKRNGYREDCYVRATVYKSDEAIGVKLHGIESKLNLLSIPFGDYISVDEPISCGTVSWRRTGDLNIPSRAKVVGSYVNPAFSKTEASLNGHEEAIVLTQEGKVSEGSAENLFMVRKGRLVTPGVNADILEGITRSGIIEIASANWASSARSEPSTAVSSTWPTRSSSAVPARRSHRSASIDHRVVGRRRGGAGHRTHHGHILRRGEGQVGGLRGLGRPGLLARQSTSATVDGARLRLERLGLLADDDDDVRVRSRLILVAQLALLVLERAASSFLTVSGIASCGAVVEGDDGPAEVLRVGPAAVERRHERVDALAAQVGGDVDGLGVWSALAVE